MKRSILITLFYVVLALVVIFSKSISIFLIESCNNSFDILCNNTVATSNPFGF